MTPLSASTEFETPFVGQVRVTVQGKGENGIAISHTFSRNNTDYIIPLHGLYQDYLNVVNIDFLDVDGNVLSSDTAEIQTEALESTPNFQVQTNNLDAEDDHLYMEVGLKAAFDQRGEVRWVYTGNDMAQIFDRLSNGNWIASNPTGVVVYHWPTFNEVDLLGNVIQTYNVPNLGHHEIRAVDNGERYLTSSNSVPMLAGGYNDFGTLQEDTVVEIDALTGEVVIEVDFNEVLDNQRTPIIFQSDDWFHINSVDLDIGADGVSGTEDDGHITSGRHQAAVVKTARNTGELVWILGAHESWSESFQEFLLTPIDSEGNSIDVAFQNFWPYGQHSAIVLPNRNILMYDNGNERGFYKETPQGENQYTRAVEYKIDEENMTIEKVWEFDYMRSIYTFATGEIDYLPESGHRLISFMWQSPGELTTPRVVELDQDDNIVFEYTINEGSNGYRSDKFKLYENIQ